jgi:hypothetical protein
MGVRPVTLVEAHPASTAIAKMNPITFGDGFMAGMLALLKQCCPQATPDRRQHQADGMGVSSMIGSIASLCVRMAALVFQPASAQLALSGHRHRAQE